jgi:hypothetical protein
MPKSKASTVCTFMNMNQISMNARDCLESIAALRELEAKHYVPTGYPYLAAPPQEHEGRERDAGEILSTMSHHRARLVQWCFKIVDHFDLPRYLVEWAMNFSDRFCGHSPDVCTDVSTLQAIVGGALHLTIKLDAGQAEKSTTRRGDGHLAAMGALPELIGQRRTSSHQVADGKQELEDFVVRLESLLMRVLGFHLHPILTETYILEFMKLSPLSGVDSLGANRTGLDMNKIVSIAVAIAEAAVTEVSLCTAPRSQIALAAILNALLSTSSSSAPSTAVLVSERGAEGSVRNMLHSFMVSTLCSTSKDELEALKDKLMEVFQQTEADSPRRDCLRHQQPHSNVEHEGQTLVQCAVSPVSVVTSTTVHDEDFN